MDAGQWYRLLGEDSPARFLNRRYLVVPVRSAHGVFHPKLNLLARETSAQLLCGSNNLTRSGCSSNLELLTSIPFSFDGDPGASLRLAQDAYSFFKRACDDADQEPGRIARQWLDELRTVAPWLTAAMPKKDTHDPVRLLHTYTGSLWDRLTAALDTSPPRRILVISPFYDADGAMVARLRQRWPKCKIELVVQQQTTTLSPLAVRRLRKYVGLSELRNSSRRLHAKLLAWETSNGTGCLVGSANFTTAAFDARNVETCLLVLNAGDLIENLFDKQLAKQPLAFDDFEPGTEQEPGVEVPLTNLRLLSALLTERGELKIAYRHDLPTKPWRLQVALRVAGEAQPRVLLPLPAKDTGTTTTVIPPQPALEDAYGTILASLVAEVTNERHESPPVWVIQEERLTYEASGQDTSSPGSRIEESGEGLLEFLEELGKRDGIFAIVDYLRHLNIRFNDGGSGIHHVRRFRLRIHDPFHPDLAPEWLLQARTEADDLASALLDFADRHFEQRLCKHARRGNINGVENFLDILTTLVRVLYVYYLRGVVHRDALIGRLCRYLEVSTRGVDLPQDSSEGYLCSLYDNLRNSRYLQEASAKLNLLGHLRAILLIVQRVRYVPGERAAWGTPRRFSDCLPDQAKGLRDTIKQVRLAEPSKKDVMKALEEYNVFLPTEVEEFEREMS
jgi:HKD family nuclease